MSLSSRFFAWAAKLPPAETHDVAVERDLPVPMPDGVALLADRYYPRGRTKPPTVLVRSPYGRAGYFGMLLGPPFAERGFQVLIQSVRGTFGSGGTFDAFSSERADGLATVAWLQQQPWFSGEFATVGGSYLGMVQWAIAADAGPALKAVAPHFTASDIGSPAYSGGGFSLDRSLTWIHLIANQERRPLEVLLAQRQASRLLGQASMRLPLREADLVVAGRPVHYYRHWLEHVDPDDPFWAAVDYSDTLRRVTVPVQLLGGWYDIFLPQTMADYGRLRAAGHSPHLIIGPWQHTAPGLQMAGLRESIAWCRAHLLGDRSGLHARPVRVYVMGAKEWRDYDQWPPPGSTAQRWHLQADRGLAPAPPAASPPDTYCYDPADPTPSVGGSALSRNSGPKDNRALEARPDVLVYTSAPAERPLEVIGPVRADLYVRSSLEHTDFFVRLCDVAPSGRSVNLCDGLRRLTPGDPPPDADGVRRVSVELWPTAHCFLPGHRLRVQVSSGAHPRYDRNLGSGEPLGTGTRLVPADQAVLHDPAHPSAIVLPAMK